MYRISGLLVAGVVVGGALMAWTGSAVAEANCPVGSTCKCVPTTFTKCKVDAQGREYDCTTSTGEKCTVVSGPGSGKPAATRGTTGGIVLNPRPKTTAPLSQVPKVGTKSPN